MIKCQILGFDLRYRSVRVRTPDGVELGVQDWQGASDGRDVLLLHGFSQSHLCWLKQVGGMLARDFRLVSYDNRGHGISDKPENPVYYQETHRWASEVAAVISQLGLYRPVLVAWSYAGRIALDYLSIFGDSAISALVMVSATSTSQLGMAGPDANLLKEMAVPELAPSIEATRKFARACFAAPPTSDDLEVLLSFSAMTPASVRAALGGRPAEYDTTLRSLSVPTLVIHGTEDRVILPAAGQYTASAVPEARLVVYKGVGHAPFWEVPDRFNHDLGEFVRNLP